MVPPEPSEARSLHVMQPTRCVTVAARMNTTCRVSRLERGAVNMISSFDNYLQVVDDRFVTYSDDGGTA